MVQNAGLAIDCPFKHTRDISVLQTWDLRVSCTPGAFWLRYKCQALSN